VESKLDPKAATKCRVGVF